MSLTDKVIKNTFYYFFSQIASIIFPLLLTPFIISKIGQVEFGIYAIVLGFIGSFGLFDLSLSSSFIKFISEYYNKKKYDELNHTINTGFLFYFVFSVLILIAGFIFTKPLLSLINIPDDLYTAGKNSFYIALIIFFVNNIFTIYSSLLISIQKMYITSVMNTIVNLLNFISVIVLLILGFRVEGLLISQLFAVTVNSAVIFIIATKSVPELKIRPAFFSRKSLKEMGSFGIQMQVSKLAGFFSEKFDEFLLGFFSVLNNVTFFNVSTRLLRFARVIPLQFIIQVAPVAAEINAKDDKEKLSRLFEDTTRYLSLISIPISVFVFIFSDEIIFSWMGKGYEISSHILRVLIVGQLLNLIISSPGNSILPNIGIPKYQMYEGLLHLIINIIFSYFLIKYYGVLGAAYGNSSATVISSVFILIISVAFFRKSLTKLFTKEYLPPFIYSIIPGILLYSLIRFFPVHLFSFDSQFKGLVIIIFISLIFLFFYIVQIIFFKYLNERDKIVIAKIFRKIIPGKYIPKLSEEVKQYEGEKISIVLITYNKIKALTLCLKKLLPELEEINYELIIWNNNSTDGTKEYLDELAKSNCNIRIVNNPVNIGNNAKSKALELATGDYMIGLDDDIIDFPENWIARFISAYKSIPDMGYMVADVIKDEKTNGGKFDESIYFEESFCNGKFIIQIGPVGGWCFLISRKVYNEVGKLMYDKTRTFIAEDGDYQLRTENRGLRTGILKGFKVYHATGEYYNNLFGNPFKNKYIEFNRNLSLIYKVKRKLSGLFSFKKISRKFKYYLIKAGE